MRPGFVVPGTLTCDMSRAPHATDLRRRADAGQRPHRLRRDHQPPGRRRRPAAGAGGRPGRGAAHGPALPRGPQGLPRADRLGHGGAAARRRPRSTPSSMPSRSTSRSRTSCGSCASRAPPSRSSATGSASTSSACWRAWAWPTCPWPPTRPMLGRGGAGVTFPYGHPGCLVCGTCKRERVRAAPGRRTGRRLRGRRAQRPVCGPPRRRHLRQVVAGGLVRGAGHRLRALGAAGGRGRVVRGARSRTGACRATPPPTRSWSAARRAPGAGLHLRARRSGARAARSPRDGSRSS